jgi:ribosomal protein S18 acetylase RimI-like enzyme
VPRLSASKPPQVRIRRARKADLAALIDLEGSVFSSDRMSARQLRRHLDNPRAEILVAVRERDLVAAAVLFFSTRHRIARLYSIAVAPRARGLGIGEALLTAAERAARTRSSTSLRLEARIDNAAARRLYERRGYRHFAVRKTYYEDGHDAARYEKALARPTGSGRHRR